MRKNALTITLISLVAGIFGAFVRWLQNLNAFEEETGLMIRGAKSTTAMIIYLILAAAVFAAVVFVWLKSYSRSTDPVKALATSSQAPTIVCSVLAVVMVLACAVLMLKANTLGNPILTRIMAACGILAGVSMTQISAGKAGKRKGRGSAFLLLILFCCVWLISSYKSNSENPVIWAFCIEILAVASGTMGVYELAAYFYGRGKPNAALFFVQLSACLCITTLADSRPLALQAVFVVWAVLMLLFEFLLVENLWEGSEKAEKAPDA